MKYIPTEKLLAEIERRRLSNRYIDTEGYENELLEIITSLQQEQPLTIEKVVEQCKKFGGNPKVIQQEQPKGGCSEKPNDLLSKM